MDLDHRSGASDQPGTRDDAGFAPIGEYGVLGDGSSVALVAADGAVDWWAAPQLDSTPVVNALLDPGGGGRLLLAPVETVTECSRRYLPGTNVLESTVDTRSGRVRITDALNTGSAGPLPWTELARRVEGVEGTVELAWRVLPGDGLGTWAPWAELTGRGPVLHAGDLTLAVGSTADGEPEIDGAAVRGTITVSAGDRVTLGVVAAHDEPLFLPPPAEIDARIDDTITRWESFSDQVDWPGEHRDAVVRSVLALKTLVMTRTGAVAAAATTSLPERVGGAKNWDYRYCWVRDASFTLDALMRCGLKAEVHAAMSWLLHAIRRNGPGIHVMYTLEGDLPTTVTHARAPGYRHSTPVQLGNDATGQMQLGVYGDLFGTVERWVHGGHVLDTGTVRLLTDLADACADTWRRPDAGIWELGTDRHYTSSKMNCWRALHAAATMADGGHLSGLPGRWHHEARQVREWIDEHCWSDSKQAYTFYAGSEDLDASVLLAARTDYDRGDRMSTTVDAVRRELGATGSTALLYRYTGVDQEEEAFLACSFWAVEALAHCGRRDEADELMAELLGMRSPLGLLSEMRDPHTSELVGNVPQALSHLALINAAAALRVTAHP